MGTFRISLEIGRLSGERFERLDALVDTGATYTWVPREVLDRLGIEPEEEWPFVLADGHEVTYPIASVRVRIDGRSRLTVAIFGDRESEPLLGAVTLEEFGFGVDPVSQRLVRVPGLLKRSA
jgi:clan AA aspartic protease